MTNQEKQAQRIVQAAQIVVMLYRLHSNRKENGTYMALELAYNEMLRLLENQIQFRNDWGDPVQVAYAIILTSEGYVPEI